MYVIRYIHRGTYLRVHVACVHTQPRETHQLSKLGAHNEYRNDINGLAVRVRALG
jgi:hypothetical protein